MQSVMYTSDIEIKILFDCLHIVSSQYHYYTDLFESIEHMKLFFGIFCGVCA